MSVECKVLLTIAAVIAMVLLYIGTMFLYFWFKRVRPQWRWSSEIIVIGGVLLFGIVVRVIILCMAKEGDASAVNDEGTWIGQVWHAIYQAIGVASFEGVNETLLEQAGGAALSSLFYGSALYTGLVVLSVATMRLNYEISSLVRNRFHSHRNDAYVFTAVTEDAVTLAHSIAQKYSEEAPEDGSRTQKCDIYFAGDELPPFDHRDPLHRDIMSNGWYYISWYKPVRRNKPPCKCLCKKKKEEQTNGRSGAPVAHKLSLRKNARPPKRREKVVPKIHVIAMRLDENEHGAENHNSDFVLDDIANVLAYRGRHGKRLKAMPRRAREEENSLSAWNIEYHILVDGKINYEFYDRAVAAKANDELRKMTILAAKKMRERAKSLENKKRSDALPKRPRVKRASDSTLVRLYDALKEWDKRAEDFISDNAPNAPGGSADRCIKAYTKTFLRYEPNNAKAYVADMYFLRWDLLCASKRRAWKRFFALIDSLNAEIKRMSSAVAAKKERQSFQINVCSEAYLSAYDLAKRRNEEFGILDGREKPEWKGSVFQRDVDVFGAQKGIYHVYVLGFGRTGQEAMDMLFRQTAYIKNVGGDTDDWRTSIFLADVFDTDMEDRSGVFAYEHPLYCCDVGSSKDAAASTEKLAERKLNGWKYKEDGKVVRVPAQTNKAHYKIYEKYAKVLKERGGTLPTPDELRKQVNLKMGFPVILSHKRSCLDLRFLKKLDESSGEGDKPKRHPRAYIICMGDDEKNIGLANALISDIKRELSGNNDENEMQTVYVRIRDDNNLGRLNWSDRDREELAKRHFYVVTFGSVKSIYDYESVIEEDGAMAFHSAYEMVGNGNDKATPAIAAALDDLVGRGTLSQATLDEALREKNDLRKEEYAEKYARWKKISTNFKQESNKAVHAFSKVYELLAKGVSNGSGLDVDPVRLEKVRWIRAYMSGGWVYDGKKQEEEKKHCNLYPYECENSDTNKRYDAINFLVSAKKD